MLRRARASRIASRDIGQHHSPIAGGWGSSIETCHARLLGGQVARHDIPIELLESLHVIGMPDDVKGGLASVFHVRQETRLTKVGQDELEIALLDPGQAGRRDVERPAERVQWIRRLVFTVRLNACRAEARAAAKAGASIRVISNPE